MKALIKYLRDRARGFFTGTTDFYLGSSKGSNQKSTIVGIFDNAHDLDRALERLARAGFEDTVYDEAIVGEEPANLGTLVFAPGQATPVAWSNIGPTPSLRKPEVQTVVRAFKAHLADYQVPAEVIEAYTTTFSHKGEFVLVRADARAGQAVEILRESGATRVTRHE